LNRRVVNTRAAHQADAFDAILRARGAVPLHYPCIEIAPAENPAVLDASLRHLAAGCYEWLALTSANTVVAIAHRLEAADIALKGAPFRCAAVGPATAEAARDQLGLECAVVPEEFVAESLGESIPVLPGERVLLPESAIARPALARILTARGARVTVVPAYRTVCGQGGENIADLLAEKRIDALTFTSTSTVTNFLERLEREGGRREDLSGVCVACIGPRTAEAAREGGLASLVVPTVYTLEGLADALDRHFSSNPSTREDRP
jgi:uroporphyrinogen-III synthase